MNNAETEVNQNDETKAEIIASSQPVETVDDHFFKPDSDADIESPNESIDPLSWTAPEFIAHSKTTSWYLALIGGAVGLAALIWLVTDDYLSAGAVIFAAAMFGIYAARQARMLPYEIDNSSVSIGARRHNFQEFKSFSIVPEKEINSIVFMPLKRFSPTLTIYYDPKIEEKVIKIVSQHLPVEEYKPDFIDRILRHIEF